MFREVTTNYVVVRTRIRFRTRIFRPFSQPVLCTICCTGQRMRASGTFLSGQVDARVSGRARAGTFLSGQVDARVSGCARAGTFLSGQVDARVSGCARAGTFVSGQVDAQVSGCAAEETEKRPKMSKHARNYQALCERVTNYYSLVYTYLFPSLMLLVFV